MIPVPGMSDSLHDRLQFNGYGDNLSTLCGAATHKYCGFLKVVLTSVN